MLRVLLIAISAAFALVTTSGCVSETRRDTPASVKQAPRTVRVQDASRKSTTSPPRSESSASAAPISDPCADRLHALCGPLLLYYSVYRKLPTTMDDLRKVAGPDPDVAFDCPVSGKPYVFDLHGPKRSTGPGFLILYDPAPTHAGHRWAVAAEEPRNTAQPLVTHVVMEPETTFNSPATPSLQVVPTTPTTAPAAK